MSLFKKDKTKKEKAAPAATPSATLDLALVGRRPLGGRLLLEITGALGGAIVYGPDIDPFVRTIYDLLF